MAGAGERLVGLGLVVMLSGCCNAEKEYEQRRLARLEADKVRRAAAASAEIEAAMNAPAPAPTPVVVKLTPEELRAENDAMAKAKAADEADHKKLRDDFAGKVKRQAKCDSVVVEDGKTLHTEHCLEFYPPLSEPALFDEAQRLGFQRIHNHSDLALCSYYLVNYPKQKVWKCRKEGTAWPGP